MFNRGGAVSARINYVQMRRKKLDLATAIVIGDVGSGQDEKTRWQNEKSVKLRQKKISDEDSKNETKNTSCPQMKSVKMRQKKVGNSPLGPQV